MPTPGGTITRKDLITDDALKFGDVLVEQLDKVIKKEKELVEITLQYAKANSAVRKVENQQDFLNEKQKIILLEKEAISVLNQKAVAEINIEKIKRQSLATSEAERKAKQASVKLTLDEKVINEANNKILKQEARERQGLVSAYEKLNRSRLESQKRLADLLSAENKNTAAIIIAQKEFDKLDTRVKAVDAAINNYSKNIGNYGSAFEGLNETARNLLTTFGLIGGIELFGVVVKDVFTIVREFDRQLIAVGKTTNITGEDLKQFGREVVELGDKLDGITVNGLIQSAEVAGQLGVTGTDNILKFSEAIEKLKLTSNIISDEQVGNFAKFIEVSSDSFENADRLASVITQLGNSFATTEAEVLSNATEIQKGIAVYNTSAQGVLALGAATSTLGSEAESSRSAIQSTFAVIDEAITSGKNLEKVLKLTGLTQKELSQQFKQDATGVFQKFIKGLSDAKNQGENLRAILNDVEITEKRAFTVVGSLAANYGILESAMLQANKEYLENAALNKEVAAASESIDSIISDLTDKWEAYVLQTNDANNGTEALTKTLKFLRDNFKEIINFVLKAGTVLIVYLGIIKAYNFIITTSAALQTAWTAGQIRFALSTGIGTQSILAQAAAARTATVAQEGLNIAVKATPWGLILGFLSAAVVAYMVFNDEMSEAEKNVQNIIDANKRLEASEKGYATERDKSNSVRFKSIEEDIRLRKAQGENSDKLDKEEIARKKAILEASLQVYSDLKRSELERTVTEINSSKQRIAQFQIEKNALEKSGYRVSKEGRTSEDLEILIKTEKDKNNIKQAGLKNNSKLTTEEIARLNKQIQDLEKDNAVKDAEFKAEADKKAIERRKKHLKNLYDIQKKAYDDEFKLSQFRYQVAIDMENEILENEKASYDERIEALLSANQILTSKNKEATEYNLKQLGKYNEDTGKFIRELSDLEIKSLIETGHAKKKLTSEQQLIYEQYQNAQTKAAEKGEKERLKLLDAQVSDIKKQIDAELLSQDTKLNAALEAENILYQSTLDGHADLEQAQEEHERNILEIKKSFAKQGLDVQIKAIEDLLANQDKLPENERISAAKRAEIDNELARLKKENSDSDVENHSVNTKKILFFEEENFKKIEEKSRELAFALSDLGNAIFDAKIQHLDEEISKNDEYYNRQIELAGNDERQKDLIQKERDKKNDDLEKKKRKEQHKQAVFNKALAITEAGINTAKAVTAALTAGPGIGLALAVITAAVAAVQLAAIVATPIPKYKDGRKGGPKEIAMINDGGVTEVVEHKDGTAETYSGKNRIVQLLEGDTVHKSIQDYEKLQYAAMMANIQMQGRKMSEFQANQYFNTDNKELLEELKRNTRAVEKNKSTVVVNQSKLDINHHLWKMKNTNWN